MDKERFGEKIKLKRQEKGFTLRGFADALNIAPSYMSDIEKGKRNPPAQEIIEKMIVLLELKEEEKNDLLDLAATEKDTLAYDIAVYVNDIANVRVALRKAKELNLGEERWIEIIKQIEESKK